MDTLVLLHTAPVQVDAFDRLLAEMAPDIPARHIVAERLLQMARDEGVGDATRQQVGQVVDDARAAGARVVLCTCSTIGGCAEAAGALRIDRPMAEAAVAFGRRILVVAALASTIGPTRALLNAVAAEQTTAIELRELVCERAWKQFERGDREAYLREIAKTVKRGAASADVVVLAQASMAGAVELCTDLQLPILSSPRSGLAAAITAYREG